MKDISNKILKIKNVWDQAKNSKAKSKKRNLMKTDVNI